jgi:hypothetical protein
VICYRTRYKKPGKKTENLLALEHNSTGLGKACIIRGLIFELNNAALTTEGNLL